MNPRELDVEPSEEKEPIWDEEEPEWDGESSEEEEESIWEHDYVIRDFDSYHIEDKIMNRIWRKQEKKEEKKMKKKNIMKKHKKNLQKKIRQKKWQRNIDEAETLLVEALNKDARDPETLANLVVCCLHLGKPSSKSFSQLKLSHPDHVLVKRVSAAEETFDRALQSFT